MLEPDSGNYLILRQLCIAVNFKSDLINWEMGGADGQ